ncbi:IclR family transcriptional regulator [Mesorhizobium sp. M5C.F.Cr.IN.023.01.1.1]|uniref:IclR family transcriptional regulator n=1 Tax=Mesorhizobium sp. M5C.F.Cr.IN.023.01.1.1 TaxID=2496768 RepID=UPI000FCBDD45|nr:IclR family transcriptional regulator [Mesorhizobium sp. M5C.F.Cr.IN.023.01.1.1]RUV68578.1 IclR family transcriptional regulator [Mesorhizobium sp. M5C.F.Cr.IN.023.01.1.1]
MGVPPVRALSRGLSVIEMMARASVSLGPSVIAEATGLDRATTSRLLQTLIDDGYVRRTSHGNYSLTSKLLELSSSSGIALGLREIARPFMRELRDMNDETVHLGILESDRIVYIEKLEPTHQRVALITSVGQTMPVHSTALGKAILAEMTPAVMNAVLDRIRFDPRTKSTILTREAFLVELEKTRARGYAVDHGENLPDASCVAAPIHNKSGDVVAALSISSPTFRIADSFEEIGPVVRSVADRISSALAAV